MSGAPEREPVVGWRKWRADPESGLLYSIFKARAWEPQVRFEARCLRGGVIWTPGRSCHHPPQARCQCGVWAVRDRDQLDIACHTTKMQFLLDGRPPAKLDVVGRVSLWGRMLATEHGWRGQYAYPYELFVVMPPTRLHVERATQLMEQCVQRLRANYAVETYSI